jgi:hypothetical protein
MPRQVLSHTNKNHAKNANLSLHHHQNHATIHQQTPHTPEPFSANDPTRTLSMKAPKAAQNTLAISLTRIYQAVNQPAILSRKNQSVILPLPRPLLTPPYIQLQIKNDPKASIKNVKVEVKVVSVADTQTEPNTAELIGMVSVSTA